METITAGGSQYQLYSLTGTVVKENTHVRTTVTGRGGGGYTHNGYGGTAPVVIDTIHTTHNQLFLVDRSGKEHAINLTNFNLDCREGHELTLVWAIKQGRDRGPYIAVKNHNTTEVYYHDYSIKAMYRPAVWIGWGIIALAFFIGLSSGGFFTGLIYGLVSFVGVNIVYNRLIASGARTFKSGLRFGV